jgi:hypothetical protein
METWSMSTMKQFTAALALTGAILMMGRVGHAAESAQASTAPPTAQQRPAHFALVDAAPSVDALIQRVIDALAKNDVTALHRVRVTEEEYRSFFPPGGGDPDKPPRAYDKDTSDYAWQMLNTNGIYAAASIMKGYGGHKYNVKEVNYLKGRKEYAWFTAYKTVSLKLEDESGAERNLVLGSIADVDGQFKFVGLLGNR